MSQIFYSFFTDNSGNNLSNYGDTINNSPRVINDNGIELGLRFYSSISGYIAGVSFFKASTNAALIHTCVLYDQSGNNIGLTTSSNENTGGWNTAMFNSPIAISANTIYTVSYLTRYYVSTDNFFYNGTIVEGPLVAEQGSGDNVSSNTGLNENGVFHLQNAGYITPVYPDSANLAQNYWVDPVFMINLGQTGLSQTDLATLPAGTLTFPSYVGQNQIQTFFLGGSYSQQAGLASNPNLPAQALYIFNALILAQIPYFPMNLLTSSQIGSLNSQQLSAYIDPLTDYQLQVLKGSLTSAQSSALLFNFNLTSAQRSRINVSGSATAVPFAIDNLSPYQILLLTSANIKTYFGYSGTSYNSTTVLGTLKSLNSSQLLALRTNFNSIQLNPTLASYVELIPNPTAATAITSATTALGHLEATTQSNPPTIMRISKSNNFTVSILNSAGNAWVDNAYQTYTAGYEIKSYNLCLSFKKISN